MEPPIRGRHARQIRVAGIGEEGQRRIGRARVAVVGLGALGSVAAEMLARAGVGQLVLVDRDFVEETNLQRQVLYTEADAREGTPKAEAARRALAAVDSAIAIEAHVADLTPASIDRLLRGADVVVDGTDNFSTRYLLNDWSVERGVPWVYGAAVSTAGLVMPVLPGETACLRCVFPEPTPPEQTETCETAGIVASASGMIALAEATEALKIVCGAREALQRGLLQLDPWAGSYRLLRVDRDPGCPCCARGERPFLRGERGDATATLCGRDSVQVSPSPAAGRERRVDLAALSLRLPGVERVTPHFVRFVAEGHRVTLFPDGRAIVGGTVEPAVARGLYARWIGA